MFDQPTFEKIASHRKGFLVFNAVTIIFFSGILFTFVIPMMKGFILSQFLMAILVYVVVANIYSGLYKKNPLFVFISVFIFSSLGVLWRVLLEWGEYSLNGYVTPTVIGGYLLALSIFVTTVYSLIGVRLNAKNPQD